jgi:hypothetical protein
MINDFFESDLVQIDPAAFSQVQRLPKPGTSGMVFRVVDRQTGKPLAVKISYAEETSKGCLLAEAEALSSSIKGIVEPGAEEPTVRRFERRMDPFARVGLVMEWLDDSFTPLEKLVRDPNVKLTDLQVLRIIAPFTAVLAAAHREGFVYVDVGAQKADHLWWRVQQTADGQWVVPRDTSGNPRFQLKVIDWANAINMDDPAYLGNVTPADDIAGVGELMFYVSHGPSAPIPTRPNDPALNPRKGSLDDIIRRAMFIDAEGSFVKESQKNLSPRDRVDVLRDPKRRSSATVEMDTAVRDLLAILIGRYEALVKKARDAVAALDQAAKRGLIALNAQIPLELQNLGQASTSSDLNGQALELMVLLKDIVQRARDMDPDRPETESLAVDLARQDKLMAERRGLENVRRLVCRLDLKQVSDAITRLRKDGEDFVLAEDLALLEQINDTLKEAWERLNPEQEKATLENFVQHALDLHGVLDAQAPMRAREMVLDMTHWGNKRSMHALRLMIGRRAGADILRDQVQSLIEKTEQFKARTDEEASKANLASSKAYLAILRDDLAKGADNLRSSLNALIDMDAASDVAQLPSVRAVYDSLAETVRSVLALQQTESIFPADQIQSLTTTLMGVQRELDIAVGALAEGDIERALSAAQRWLELDPQSKLAQRYMELLGANRELGKEYLINAILREGLAGFASRLQVLDTRIGGLLKIAPHAQYLLAANSLITLTTPLAMRVAERSALHPLSEPGAGQDGHVQFANSVGQALREALTATLRSPQDPQLFTTDRATQQQVWTLSTNYNVQSARELLDMYDSIDLQQQPVRSPNKLWTVDQTMGRMPSLLNSIEMLRNRLPALRPVVDRFQEHLLAIVSDRALESLDNNDYDTAIGWLSTLPTEAARTTMALVGSLEWISKIRRQTGPAKALSQLASTLPEHNLRLLGEFRLHMEREIQRVKADLVSQQQALESVLNNLRAIQQESDLNQVSSRISEVLNYVKGHLTSMDAAYKRDLQPLEQAWAEAMSRAMPDLGRPVSNTRVLQLARELDSIKALTASDPTAGISVLGGGVREEVLQCVYKPLAAVLRHITQVTTAANTPVNATAQMGNVGGSAPGNVTPGLLYPSGRTSSRQLFDLNSPLTFAGLVMAAVGSSVMAVAFVMETFFQGKLDIFLRIGAGGLLLGLALIGGLLAAQAYLNRSASTTVPLAAGGGMLVVAIVGGVFLFSNIFASITPMTPEAIAAATATAKAKALTEATLTVGPVVSDVDALATQAVEATATAIAEASVIAAQYPARHTLTINKSDPFWVSSPLELAEPEARNILTLTFKVASGQLGYAGFSFWAVSDQNDEGSFFIEQLALGNNYAQFREGNPLPGYTSASLDKTNRTGLSIEKFLRRHDQPLEWVDTISDITSIRLVLNPVDCSTSLTAYLPASQPEPTKSSTMHFAGTRPECRFESVAVHFLIPEETAIIEISQLAVRKHVLNVELGPEIDLIDQLRLDKDAEQNEGDKPNEGDEPIP